MKIFLLNDKFDKSYGSRIILGIGTLVIGAIASHVSKSRKPFSPWQIVFVMGTSTPSYGQTKKDDCVLVKNYDVTNHVDMIDVITRVGDTCRCVL